MIYEASNYYDKINAREKPRSGLSQQADQWRVFNTEKDARDFIIRRARIKLENAEMTLRKERKHLRAVLLKFGTPCKHGMHDPEECGLCDDERRALP